MRHGLVLGALAGAMGALTFAGLLASPCALGCSIDGPYPLLQAHVDGDAIVLDAASYVEHDDILLVRDAAAVPHLALRDGTPATGEARPGDRLVPQGGPARVDLVDLRWNAILFREG